MAQQRFLFRPVLSLHRSLNWPMHKCITLFCSVWLPISLYFSLPISPPLYFSSIFLSPFCLPLSPSVSIQWMEQSFLIFSLVSSTPLSNLKRKRGCKIKRSLPRTQKLLSKTQMIGHTQTKKDSHTSGLGSQQLKWQKGNKGITPGLCF